MKTSSDNCFLDMILFKACISFNAKRDNQIKRRSFRQGKSDPSIFFSPAILCFGKGKSKFLPI